MPFSFSHVWRCVTIKYALFSVIFCLVGLGIGYFIRGVIGKKRKTSAEMQAKEILESSRREAEDRKRELELQAKDELYNLRTEIDKEAQERRAELQKLEKRLITKEENIDNKLEIIEKKETSRKC